MKKIFLLFAPFMINAQSWSLAGNSGTTGTNFIGTVDNNALIFKTNNIEWLKINQKGRFIFNNIDSAPGYNSNIFFGGGNDFLTSKGNAVFGVGSFVSATTGGYNTAIGINSLRSNTTGVNNSALGMNSLMTNISGSQNTGIGMNALGLAKGSLNTSVGSHALYGGTGNDFNGDNNTAVGGYSLRGAIEGASNNTAIGAQSFIFFRTGTNNVAIGYNTAADTNLYNANNNIFIGANVQPTNASPNNELNIGNWIMGNNGVIGFGTSNLPADGIAPDGDKYKLFVKDGIRTEKIKVDIASSNGWADFVFKKDYSLPTLEEVEKHITEKGHLPNIPSANEVVKNGINLGEMDAKLLQKIEELTLYSIEQNKENKELKLRLEKIEKLLSEKNIK